MKTRKQKRRLTPGEIELATSIFGTKINYKKVRISNNTRLPLQPKDGGLCLGNTININGSGYASDYSKAPLNLQSFFIHEMTHIWQYQTDAPSLAKKFMDEVQKNPFSYMKNAYPYTLEPGKPFKEYGIEQQACIIQDYFVLKNNPQIQKYTGRCQNKNLNRREKLALYHQVLSPLFKVGNRRPPAKKIFRKHPWR